MFNQLFLYVICDKGWLMLSILLDWWTSSLNIHGQGQWVGKYKRHFKSLRNYLIKGRKTFCLYQRDESIVDAPPDHRSVCMLFCLTAITPRWSLTVQYCNIRQTDGSKIVRFDHMVACLRTISFVNTRLMYSVDMTLQFKMFHFEGWVGKSNISSESLYQCILYFCIFMKINRFTCRIIKRGQSCEFVITTRQSILE